MIFVTLKPAKFMIEMVASGLGWMRETLQLVDNYSPFLALRPSNVKRSPRRLLWNPQGRLAGPF